MLCVFDVNETLLDLAGLDDFFADLPLTREQWFDRMIHNALVLTAADQYRAFGEIAMASLPSVATAEQKSELGQRMRRLPAHPDAAPALTRLREAGFTVATLTNSVLDVAEDQLRNSGLRPLVDLVYSADQVKQLKPGPKPYQHVLAENNNTDTVLIAAHDWDVAGAAAAGMRTAFVAREGRVPLPAAPAPTFIADDLAGIADQLLAHAE